MSIKLFYIKKPKIYDQIDEYCEWKHQRGNHSKKEYLLEFAKKIDKAQLRDITYEDMQTYLKSIRMTYNGLFEAIEHTKAVRCLFRYYKARKYHCINPEVIHLDFANEKSTLRNMPTVNINRVGRPTDTEMVRRVKELRKKGLTFRKISEELGRDVKTVHAWSRK